MGNFIHVGGLQGEAKKPSSGHRACASFMAGIKYGIWDETILTKDRIRTVYEPAMDPEKRNRKYSGWKNAVQKAF